ncbi:MAG: ribosome silencing factor [Dehalococcoidia bacterium]|nr:ribosome silencing factor [Dehalococcoidia bacterium]
MTETTMVDARALAETAFDIADEKQASNIVLLDVREACDYADYTVIMTAESTRQLRSMVDDVEQGMKKAGAFLHHVEGTHNSGWILMDYGDVLVHLMGPEERDFYGLETVWAMSRQIRVIP